MKPGIFCFTFSGWSAGEAQQHKYTLKQITGFLGMLGIIDAIQEKGVPPRSSFARASLTFSLRPRDDLKPILGNGSAADNRFKSSTIMKLYVGNFPFDMTEGTLRELFEPFGSVSEAKLVIDHETGQSRGFGFVTMGNASEGHAAIKGLNGKDKAAPMDDSPCC